MFSTLRFATVMAIALSTAAPAFALCNPGTPHCVTAGGPFSRLAQAKNAVFNQGASGQCDPGPAGICSDAVQATPKTPLTPVPTTGTIVVK